jgi:TRAP transporter TAXI family solute receptor
MGEVYRAHDDRLQRDVAIKVLPTAFADDKDRVARFRREAQAVAALSHPNIVAIHDTGIHRGQAYAVTELLEGESLRHRIRRGPFPVRKALDIGVQIAKGLAAAHDRGIVHRDLKPENVFLLKDGQVKILDFGLAKEIGRLDDVETAAITDPGVVMGTLGYMSPEQLRGQAVDGRSDVFSLGALLYEVVSGAPAFRRATGPDTITAVLTDDPPAFPPAVPPASAVERIVWRCLEKEPAERFQSARDLAFALEAAAGPSGPDPAPGAAAAVPAPSRSTPQSRLPWYLVGVLGAAVLVLAFALWNSQIATPAEPRVLRLGTGAPGGVYRAIGLGLVEVLEKKLSNTRVVVRPTDGAFQNMELLERGEIDLALSQNDVAFHSVKTDRVLGLKSTRIAALGILYPEPAQIVVNRKLTISRVQDLRGKRVAVGLPRSGSRFSTEVLLGYFGLKEADYQPSYVDISDAARQVGDGTLDAAITFRAIPAPAFEEVFRSGRVALLSLDAEALRGLRVANPFLVQIQIPAHVYATQDSAVSSVGVKAMLVGRADLDDGTVEQALTAIFSSIPDLIAHHPRASEISLANAFRLEDGLSIDLHPAARRFFERQPQRLP